MRRRVGRLPLRVRLVAGFAAVMLVVLTAAGAFVFWRVEYALDRGLARDLDQATATLLPLVAAGGQVSDVRAADATGLGWQTLTDDGGVVARGGPAPTAPLVGPAVLADAASGPLTRDVGSLLPVSADPFRTRVVPVDDRTTLVVAVRRDARDEALRELLLQLGLAGLGALVLTALVGDRLAWFALLPVERYRRRAEQITGGAVGVRLEVPAHRDDEVTRLGHTLNDMLAELERSLVRERRFVDEASHELRTPLTLVTSRIQLARRRPRSVAEHERVLDELEVDVRRLTDLAQQLLTLGAAAGQADPGARSSPGTDLVPAVTEVLAHRGDTGVGTVLPQAPVVVATDPETVRRLLTNLLDNAAHHGAEPVEVRVDAARSPDGRGWGRLVVADAGEGMPTELLGTATGRFTRAVESRARPGAGLGLAIVEALVSAAGGELRLCHDGEHRSHGHDTALPCSHDDRMSVTALLPLAAGATTPRLAPARRSAGSR